VLLLLGQLCVDCSLLEEAQASVQECIAIQQVVFPTAPNPSVVSGASNAPDGAPAGMPIVLVLHPSAAESASLMASICKAHIR
jgi:hypothetical protein